MTGPVAVLQCEHTDPHGRRCALVAGHGVAFHGHLRGAVVDGHLYSTGEDLSEEIRTQLRLDEIASLRAEVEIARASLAALTEEQDAMRPVVDAACVYVDAAGDDADHDIACVVDAYRQRGGR